MALAQLDELEEECSDKRRGVLDRHEAAVQTGRGRDCTGEPGDERIDVTVGSL